MMGGLGGHGQLLALAGVFGEFLDGDHLLTARADAAGAEALAGP